MSNKMSINYSFRFCPNCRNKGELLNSDIYQNWLKKMQCTNKACSTIWYLCCTCTKMRKHMVTKEQVTSHARTFHKQRQYKRMKHEPQERKETSELQPQRALQQSCTEPPTVHHVRRQESIDFITNPNSIKHTPITFLTAKSLNLLHVIEKLNQEDLEAVNTMSEFVFTLNRCQIEKFGTVMEN